MSAQQFIAPELRVQKWIDGQGQERESLKLAELGDGYKLSFALRPLVRAVIRAVFQP